MTTTRGRFPGAHAFGDDDLSRVLFQGRADESAALAHQVSAHRLVVLFARSGVGKTSLLAAGIAERLRQEDFVPLTVRVSDRAVGPVRSVIDGIAACCRAQGVECADAPVDGGLWTFFKTATFWKDDVLLCPVLVLDQFEELFTLYPEDARRGLVDDLSCLVRGLPPRSPGQADGLDAPPPRLRIVLSLREDFLAYLEELSDRVPGIMEHRFRLLPLTRHQAASAITRPLAVEAPELKTVPFGIHPDALTAVLGFLESERRECGAWNSASIEPFQLQVVCQYVEGIAAAKQQKAPARATIEIEAADVGGPAELRRVVQTFYEAQVSAIRSWRQRRRARRLCSEFLISPHGRRLRLEESEITRITRVNKETLDVLLARRILRAETGAGGTYYEISHDSLVNPIVQAGSVRLVFRGLLLLFLTVVGLAGAIMLTAVLGANLELPSTVDALIILVGVVGLLAVLYRAAVNDMRSFRVVWQRLRNLLTRSRRRLSRRTAPA